MRFAKQNTFAIFTGAYQAIAFVLIFVAPVLARVWVQQPFITQFVEQTLVFSLFPPTTAGSWELFEQGLGTGDRVSAVNGVPVVTSADFYRELNRYQVGDPSDLTISLRTGGEKIYPITLIKFSLLDQIYFFYLPYIVGIVYLVSSLWVFGLRWRDPTGRTFSMFTTSVALVLISLFDLSTTHRLTVLWTTGLALAGGSIINLAFVFPAEDRLVQRFSYLRWIGYVPAFLLIANALPRLYDTSRPTAYVNAWLLIYVFAGIGGLFFVGFTIYRFFRTKATSPITHEQSKLVLLGSALGFGPITFWFLAQATPLKFPLLPGFVLALSLFPLIIGYTLLRYRFFKTDYLVSRVLLYALLTIMLAVAYGLVIGGFGQVMGAAFPTTSPYLSGIIIFALALLIFPLRTRMQIWIDRIFARAQSLYRAKLQDFTHDLTQTMDLKGIISLLHRYIDENLSPAMMHIFIYDPLSDHYLAQPNKSGQPSSDLRFSSQSPLVQTLVGRRKSIFLGEAFTIPSALQAEKARLALLGSQVFIPLPGQSKLTGWVTLSGRQSGEPYTDSDLDFLEALNDQAALAIERAQVVNDLERRMLEMNVLTRVSQGINVTLNFDDILELIYAQTNQIVPVRDFRLTLHDSFSNYLYHVFFLENDERLNERENSPLPLGQGLEQEVVENRRPLITEDYERECRNRGSLPSASGIFAWIGVPLNAGAETIGVMGLGSRDPSISYTESQVNLLQAIADQAAGAIIKGRLLQESERRTRQLTTLNEVARSLTSTLELDKLLNQILNSAVEILNCGAGSLLLVNEETDELMFEVATGPVAQDLIGKRLPKGTGLVGKAVETRHPIVANDVRRTQEWHADSDQQTGFKTEDLLVVPMQVKDRVIGVIEVINRRDGLPFTPDDQELLAAFTSQAAIAIENARLYTLTDQALADRVEELSVMQRIDRELNASLDISVAMRITLSWAVRRTGAEAGLVGVVEEKGVRVMASAGYTSELDSFPDAYLPADLPIFQRVFASGQPQILQANGNKTSIGLFSSTQSQVAVPIRREEETIGVMLLESGRPEAYDEESLEFLSRLGDHAAIAIANAQLYSEVQSANLAKSKFVSFVAHELKNPMASIKGYTELVAGGMAGPVNETQSQFLATVSANLDRMNTIVSDLNDLTKIEVGALRLDYKVVDIIEIIEDTLRSLKRQIDEKEQKFELSFPESLPKVWADPARVSQIMVNLVSNAHKYTPQGGNVSIGVEPCETREGISGDKKEVHFLHVWVKDTGIGIKLEDQGKIFQQYFRTEMSKDFASGTGLGLNISKTLVEMQGGSIWFDSEVDQGSTFHITVPIAETA